VPDLVIANSRFTARPAAKLFQGSTVEVLYLPVPCPDIGDRLATSSRIRAELSTPNDATVILMVSRIEKSKGHAILLDALRDLQEVPGWFAWVVGGAQKQSEIELLRQLRRTAEQLGLYERFRFAGPRNDIADVMTAANIYCQPNTGPEGFGLTFVEALYAQLPVVTSGFGGAIEIVDETCGVLTPPGDSIAVAEALKGLINSPVRRQALGGSGPCRASHLCDPARHLDRLTMLAS
jgi:glycosyltransferase involved in cell wall biosynthesis